MTPNSEAFDRWIRSSFRDINTELEELYFNLPDSMSVKKTGETLKEKLYREGAVFIRALLDEGNTDEPFDDVYRLLGNIGFYMAALKRHEVNLEAHQEECPYVLASALSMHVGSSLGVAPRYASSHLTTHNLAAEGTYKSFTTLEDELLFIEYNTRAIFGFKRAADALRRIAPVGITSPIARTLLQDCNSAILDVIKFYQELHDKLDVDRFFFNVRPYYKPYTVGRTEYRGVNAGDFAGINELDLMLGLCSANDPLYVQLLNDKIPFITPEDQSLLRDCLARPSYLDQLLKLCSQFAGESWFRENLSEFLHVCENYGKTAEIHHNWLVKRFISGPTSNMDASKLEHITASGPPLPQLLSSLERLRDLRMAKGTSGDTTRESDLMELRQLVDPA